MKASQTEYRTFCCCMLAAATTPKIPFSHPASPPFQARNVLLRSDAGQAHRGMVAKVADFGLSVAVDQAQTHVSAMRQVCGRGGGRGVDQAQTHVHHVNAMRQVCGGMGGGFTGSRLGRSCICTRFLLPVLSIGPRSICFNIDIE